MPHRGGGWLISTALAGLAVLALAAAALGDGGLQLDITQCDPTTGQTCTTQHTSVERAPKHKPKPPVAHVAAQPPKPVERHDVDLKHHKDKVRTADGKEHAAKVVSVDLSDHHAHKHAAAKSPATPTLPAVSTVGGSPFAGFGSAFDYVSGDEALARFAIPPFLVPIYVAAGRAYGVPWNLLAAINQIETDFGRIEHQVSSAGALGWMQFMPGTWKTYGVDASGDGIADPYNPVDAIYGAARYLKAAGADTDVRRAVLAYNHADWYADSVLHTAGIYGSLPGGLVQETGSLAFGRFPVRGRVTYGDDFRRALAAGRPARGLLMHGRRGAAAIATQDVTVKRVLVAPSLARVLRHRALPKRGLERRAPVPALADPKLRRDTASAAALLAALKPLAGLLSPSAAAAADRAALTAGRNLAAAPATSAPKRVRRGRLPGGFAVSNKAGIAVVVADALGNTYRYGGLAKLRDGVRPGARIRGGRALGSLSADGLLFSVRAAGGEPVDPRPLVDGYRLQEIADFQHAVAPLGGSPFVPDGPAVAGGVVKGSDRELAKRVLSDPRIHIYPGGIHDIESGIIDRRVLGALLYLSRNGLELTISCLRTGHSFYTSGGNVSAHSFGAAVDISAFNGEPVVGHQGPGSLTEQAIKLLMRLHGSAQPAQLISLMALGGPSFAMADHYDHLHVGYRFSESVGVGRSGDALGNVTFDGGKGMLGVTSGKAKPADLRKLARKLGAIRNPNVHHAASSAGLPVEGETAADAASATRLADKKAPLRALPTTAGAKIVDVDIPAGARGDEAYALARVDGTGRGWARSQVVVLAHRHGTWSLVGPPRNARGRATDPRLVALATAPGGRGYAVGANGRIARLRGDAPPQLLASHTKSDLAAVAVRGTSAVAVGDGVAVALDGTKARRESAPASLRDVAYDGATPVAAGGAQVFRRVASGWRAVGGKVEPGSGLSTQLNAVAADDGALWAAGAVTEGGSTLPVAARLRDGRWQTFCAGSPALAAIRELGAPPRRGDCDEPLVLAPGERGGAGAIAVTRRGVVLATAAGAQRFDGHNFRPVPAAPASFPTLASRGGRLALGPDGQGWALGADGRMARIAAAESRRTTGAGRADATTLARAELATVAATPGGDRALAFAGDAAALGLKGHWPVVAAPPEDLRSVAWASDDEAWAITATGSLLHFKDLRWSAAQDADAQLAAIAFRGSREGYAVGAGGAILRYDGKTWRSDRRADGRDLLAVAAGPAGVVAAGRGGLLLERVDGRWVERGEVAGLAQGRDLDAASVLPDGTLLAAGDGVVLARGAHDAGWALAPLPPLGLPVRRLDAMRTADGSLRAVAVVGDGETRGVMIGDADGWKPLQPAGMDRAVDADLDPARGALWVAGVSGGEALAARLDRPEDAAPASAPAQGSGPVGALVAGVVR